MKHSKTLDRLIETIREDFKPDKIFVISFFEKEECYNHIALEAVCSTKKIANYDLLILVNAKNNLEQLSNNIEERTKIIANVTALVYPVEQFNTLLSYGHPFTRKIIQSDSLAYELESNNLPQTGTIDISCSPYPGRKEYERAYECAIEFVAAFQLHVVRKEYSAAAFALHQAAEQFYICAIKKATGFRIITSNLLKLQRYSYWFSSELQKILGINPETNCHLGQVLQKAYYHARYNPDYNITEETLALLMAEVKKLQGLTNKFLEENETL